MRLRTTVMIRDLNRNGMPDPLPMPLRSCLNIRKVGESYSLIVTNSKYPNSIEYKFPDIKQIFTESSMMTNLRLIFNIPKHEVTIMLNDAEKKKKLSRKICNILYHQKEENFLRKMLKTNSRQCETSSPNTSSFECTGLVSIVHFDPRILKLKFLKVLTLENCVLPSLPVQIGHLPIECLSLAGSKLASTQYDRDTIWDWMTENPICNTLSTLNMDSVGLQLLPFEVMFLQNLKNLSVSKNKLTYLPQFIGDLKRLLHLNVADNALNYLPYGLFGRKFNELDISDNPFTEYNTLPLDHILKYSMQLNNQPNGRIAVKSLLNLSIDILMDKCIKFKRKEIPRYLWHYFNLMGRCDNCSKYILPQNSFIYHISVNSSHLAHNLTKNPTTHNLQWQLIECCYKC